MDGSPVLCLATSSDICDGPIPGDGPGHQGRGSHTIRIVFPLPAIQWRGLDLHPPNYMEIHPDRRDDGARLRLHAKVALLAFSSSHETLV